MITTGIYRFQNNALPPYLAEDSFFRWHAYFLRILLGSYPLFTSFPLYFYLFSLFFQYFSLLPSIFFFPHFIVSLPFFRFYFSLFPLFFLCSDYFLVFLHFPFLLFLSFNFPHFMFFYFFFQWEYKMENIYPWSPGHLSGSNQNLRTIQYSKLMFYSSKEYFF